MSSILNDDDEPDFVSLWRPAGENACKCGAAGEFDHTCPFSEELNGCYDKCNCCVNCTRECAMDV